MSDPRRFDPLPDGMWQNSAGDYVLHADYARLKAEVSRLKMEESKLLTLCETYEGEVERLIKAGDAMASSIQFKEEMEQDYEGPTYVRKCVKDWNAAKEASQA